MSAAVSRDPLGSAALALVPAPRERRPSLADLAEVEGLMRALARGEREERAGRMALEQLASGGKRLRASLALRAAAVLGCNRDDAIAWAAAVELLHNATLIHDDIQDGDALRRGRPTIWAVHGTAQAINAGDLMLMLPFAALAHVAGEHRGSLACAIAGQALCIVRGQSAELDLLPEGALDWRAYSDAARDKTGALFGLCVEGAALLGGMSAAQAASLAESFVLLGLLFQLQDDVLDLYGDKGRHERGSDLYEGKVSALVVAHLARRPRDSAWLLELLRTPRAITEEREVACAIAAFRDSGALSDVLAHIDALAERIQSSGALAALPALGRVADELLARALAPIQPLLRNRNT